MEVFFKNVLTKIEGHVLGEEHSNFLTYDHQYTRFDQAGAWSAEGSVARPAVLSFYIRSSLVREKNNVAPANKLSSVLSYFGGTQSARWLILLALHFCADHRSPLLCVCRCSDPVMRRARGVRLAGPRGKGGGCRGATMRSTTPT